MITSFRHDEWKRRKQRRFLAILLVLSCVLFFLRGSVSNYLGGVFAWIGRPFWALEDRIILSYESVTTLLRSKSQLVEENTRLRATLDEIALEGYGQQQLRDENADLKAMLGRQEEYNFTLARILAAPPVSPYDTLLIDIGEEGGVSVGMQAFSQGDFKVGEVTRVWGKSALVSLYSSSNMQLAVTVGESAIHALASGIGGGNLRIILPRGVEVKKGDIVSIPALGPAYLGTVDAIDAPAGSSLEAIYVRLPFDLYKERWVYLATPKNSIPVSKNNNP